MPLDPFLANLLATAGITPQAQQKAAAVQKATPTKEDLLDTNQRTDFRGEAVIVSLEHPLAEKIVKECKRKVCGAVFTTNYRPVSYCSRSCLERDLSERFGLAWIPDRDIKKERWEIRAEPFMIPESALVAMKQLVTYVEMNLGRSLDTGSQKEFPQVSVRPVESTSPANVSEPSPSLQEDRQSPEPTQEHPVPPLYKTEAPAPKELFAKEFGDLFSF